MVDAIETAMELSVLNIDGDGVLHTNGREATLSLIWKYMASEVYYVKQNNLMMMYWMNLFTKPSGYLFSFVHTKLFLIEESK